MRLQSDGAFVSLTIQDDGPEIADPGAIFRPFFVGGDPAVGLGLAIVRDIVRAHSGEISAGNEPGGHPFITMRIPRAQS